MEFHKASKRLKNILRTAERLEVSPQDLATLSGVKKLLAPRQDKSRVLQTVLPLVCTVIVFGLYCYCSLHSNNASQQSIAGHYDDVANLAT